MKHAYLILAHKNWNQLMTLLSLLDDSQNDIFLHIDRYAFKAPIEQLRASVKKTQLVFVKRIGCTWGDYSLVRAELELLKEATKTPHAYYHLLSGQDLPLKSQDAIHEFFEQNTGLEYVSFRSMGSDPVQDYLDRRLRYYFLFRRTLAHVRNPGFAYFWLRRFQKISLPLQKRLGVNRTKEMESHIYYGSQWFSISDGFAHYLLEQKGYIQKHFRWTIIPDEYFVQTVLMQSLFRDKVSPTVIRLINWKKGTPSRKRGSPDIFTAADYELLHSSDCLFARKFDETTDPDIIRMIVNGLQASE